MPPILDSSDGDLARAVAATGSREAEAAESELYQRFAPRVRLYGLRDLRDEEAARDLVQQVMLETCLARLAERERMVILLRRQLTLASAGGTRAEPGRYVLDHSASTRPA
ncbi:MAG: hypothetical protein ABI868_04055 [Acidobacteriota bacterium]